MRDKPDPSRNANIAGTPLSPEFLLAVACCRWPQEARRAAVRASAAHVADWDLFVAIVRRQRVAGLVHAALQEAETRVPAAIGRALATQAQQIARRSLSLAAETGRLQELFAAADIPLVVVKGASLAQLAYGTIALKHGRDIDLLVAPEHALAAMSILEQEGYSLRLPTAELSTAQRRMLVQYGHEVELSNPARAYVELHWRLSQNPELLRGIDSHSPTQTVRLPEGPQLRTLREPDLFAYLAVHGAAHGWSRLKWLADLNAFLAGKTDDEIVNLYAQDCGAGLCAGLALLLCHQLFGRQLPMQLGRQLSSDRHLGRLARTCLDMMNSPDGATELLDRPFALVRLALLQFRLSREPRYLLRQLRFWLIGLPDVLLLPLPDGLHFLYPLLRLPLWPVRRALAIKERAMAASRKRAGVPI